MVIQRHREAEARSQGANKEETEEKKKRGGQEKGGGGGGRGEQRVASELLFDGRAPKKSRISNPMKTFPALKSRQFPHFCHFGKVQPARTSRRRRVPT